jgi:hypothetical protein
MKINIEKIPYGNNYISVGNTVTRELTNLQVLQMISKLGVFGVLRLEVDTISKFSSLCKVLEKLGIISYYHTYEPENSRTILNIRRS